MNSKGYLSCAITISRNTRVRLLVHRMVALTFVPNPNPGVYDVIDHIDGNKTNNYYENLRWCTRSMNVQYATELGLINSKYTEKQIEEAISLMNGKYTLKEISETTKVHLHTLYSIFSMRTWVRKTLGKKLKVKNKKNHITEENLFKAIEMLKKGEYTLKEIATECEMNEQTVSSIMKKKIHKEKTKDLSLSIKYLKKNTDLEIILSAIDMMNGEYTYDDIIEKTDLTKTILYKIFKHKRWCEYTKDKILKIKR